MAAAPKEPDHTATQPEEEKAAEREFQRVLGNLANMPHKQHAPWRAMQNAPDLPVGLEVGLQSRYRFRGR